MAKAKKKSAPAKKSKSPAKKVLAKPAKKPTKVAAKKAAPVKKSAPTKKATPVKAAPRATANSTKTTTAKNENSFKSFLQPLDDRIVVLVGDAMKKTPGGLFIPETATDVSGNFQGKVMAVGRGHMNKKGKVKPLDVSVGDEVVFSQFSGSQIDLEGKRIMVIRESDVLGIVK